MTGTEKREASQLNIGGLGMGKGYELKRQAAAEAATFPAVEFSSFAAEVPVDVHFSLRHDVVPASALVSLNPFSDGGK